MNLLFAVALLAQHQTIPVLDSSGARRPEARLPEIAASWSPASLRERLVPDVGEGARSEKARSLLRVWTASFRGDWKSDFAQFRRRWPKSLSDGTWPVLASAFWRSRPEQELQSSPGLSGLSAAASLAEWVGWLGTTPLAARLALADVTSRELSKPGMVDSTLLPVGGSFSLDLSSARFDGPVRIAIERFERRGTDFSLRSESIATWDPPAARPVWISKPHPSPGLYRYVWQANGFYQQVLVRVGGMQVLGIPTDSGMLVWAHGTAKTGTRLVWKSKSGKTDSLAIDLSAPVHIGFPRGSDSGLVGVVSGGEFATLRLRRPRPGRQDALGSTEERDRRGLPILVPPRLGGTSGWHAASILERDAFEPGETMRFSGWMRHLDAYGRPDGSRPDSLRWTLEPFSGTETSRWVAVDSNGFWQDSVVVGIKGRLRVSALAAQGAIQEASYCDAGNIFRVRDPDNSCLEDRERLPLPAGAADTIDVGLDEEQRSPGLFVLTQGRALDWRHLPHPSGARIRIPSDRRLSGGVSAIVVTPEPDGWSAWRGRIAGTNACTESRFPLSVRAEIPTEAAAGSPLPEIAVATGSGAAASGVPVSIRLVPDAAASTLRPLCGAFDKTRASTEAYTGDGNWSTWGLVEPEFQSVDKRRDPDIFARIGVRPFPPICIVCGPWIGSWNTKTGKANLPGSCGWSSPARDCARQDRLGLREAFSVRVATDSSGTIPLAAVWPNRPGAWRLQAWGIDASGRILAWERTVRIR